MKGELGLDLPVIWEDASRGGKQLLDASSLSLCQNINIRAVVFLSQQASKRPEISKASGYPPVRFAQEALRMDGMYDSFIAKAVVQRLSQLPAYDMQLNDELEQNARTLRAWIERMK